MNEKLKQYLASLEDTFYWRWIANSKVSLMVLALIVVLGAYSLYVIPKESSPTIKFGLVSVTTVYPGANPLDIDDAITEKIENEIKDLDGIDKIESTSALWLSNTVITLQNGIDTQNFINEVKSKIDTVVLPTDATKPIVTELSTDNEVLFQMMLYGSKEFFSMNQVRSLAMDFAHDIKGKWSIVDVDVQWIKWDSDYDVAVYLDQGKMEDLGLTVSSVVSQIRAFNSNLPLGNYALGEKNYDYRITNELTSLGQMQEIPIKVTAGYVKLAEIASITRTYKVDSVWQWWWATESNNYAVELTIFKKAKSNIFNDSTLAKTIINESIHKVKFTWLKVKYTRDLSDIIIDDYKSLASNGGQSILIVFIITALFIGLRQATIATIAMICSFFITFGVLNLLGLTLNFMTNFSLILAFGSGIDTVVVFIEAAYANMKRWYTPKTSILMAIQRYKSANINTSLINLCVFIPLLVLPGIVGKFLSFIPITIFTTLLGSLVMALTVNSALFISMNKDKKYYYVDDEDAPDEEEVMTQEEIDILAIERQGKSIRGKNEAPWMEQQIDKVTWFYLRWLSYLLKTRFRRMMTIWMPVVAMILSFVLLAGRIGFKLFPSGDNPYIDIAITASQGTTIDTMLAATSGLDQIISQIPWLQSYMITTNPSDISVTVILKKQADRELDSFATQDIVMKQLEYLKQSWYKVEGKVQAWWPPTGKAVGIKLVAVDKTKLTNLKAVSNDFEEYLKNLTGTVNVSNSSTTSPWQFELSFNREKLAQLGLTPQDIQFEIYNALNGQKAWSLKLEWDERDIVVKIGDLVDRVSPEQITNMTIATRAGNVTVSSIATVSSNQSLTNIKRSDGQVVTTVETDLDEWLTPTAYQPKLIAFADQYQFPAGISYIAWGENQANADLIQAAGIAFIVSLFMAFGILVYQFNSFSLPAIVLYSIITAFLWVNVGLWITGNPYSMAFAIWFISLIGLVVNTAIFLVDRIKYNLEQWVDITAAIMEAWAARFKPIVISSLTALLWLWPVVTQDEFYAGLGYTVIFWLLFSAAITLYAVPMLVYGVKWGRKNDIKAEDVMEEIE
jgi:multidrug efflux pump subunit AcrB